MFMENARAYFERLASLGPELAQENLEDATGTWEFVLEGDGTWSIHVDRGRLSVSEGPTPNPTARFRMAESEFVRLARGEGHENVITSVLRGALKVEGDIRFAQRIQTLLPMTIDTQTQEKRASA